LFIRKQFDLDLIVSSKRNNLSDAFLNSRRLMMNRAPLGRWSNGLLTARPSAPTWRRSMGK
jgi:hypothetical protein